MNSPVNANHAAEFGFAHARQTSHANFIVIKNFHGANLLFDFERGFDYPARGGKFFEFENKNLPRLDRLDGSEFRPPRRGFLRTEFADRPHENFFAA